MTAGREALSVCAGVSTVVDGKATVDMVSESTRVAEALHGSHARYIGKTTNSDMQICACPVCRLIPFA
jgi:isocitrate dehydrogenase